MRSRPGLSVVQIYLMSSTIAFGIQCLALTDSKFPVWYPYYGTWLFGIVVEMFLILAPNICSPPSQAFDYAILVIQALRTCCFIVLPSTYFGLRNDKKRYEESDVEHQSLLGKKSSQKAAKKTAAVGNGYGTNENDSRESEESDTADDDNEAEDSWLQRQRQAQEKIDKRLEKDGNWFTYAKGFTVSWRPPLLLVRCSRFADLLPLPLALPKSSPAVQSCARRALSPGDQRFQRTSPESDGDHD